jgi:hypothetical protein
VPAPPVVELPPFVVDAPPLVAVVPPFVVDAPPKVVVLPPLALVPPPRAAPPPAPPLSSSVSVSLVAHAHDNAAPKLNRQNSLVKVDIGHTHSSARSAGQSREQRNI